MIKAVVFDIGSVLEVIDDTVFPGSAEERLGLASGAVVATADFEGDRKEVAALDAFCKPKA